MNNRNDLKYFNNGEYLQIRVSLACLQVLFSMDNSKYNIGLKEINISYLLIIDLQNLQVYRDGTLTLYHPQFERILPTNLSLMSELCRVIVPSLFTIKLQITKLKLASPLPPSHNNKKKGKTLHAELN